MADDQFSQGHPKETIEEASRSSNWNFPEDSLKLSELRKNFKVGVSGELARGLWYLLGFVVVVHLLTAIALAWRLSNKPVAGDTEEQRTARIEKALSTVNDTAKTLYPVLGVLTAAVSNCYFSSADSESYEGEKDN